MLADIQILKQVKRRCLFFQGLQVKGRQKISPWELIEGNKNPAPMLFSWFGAVRLERKPLPHETDLPRTRYHNFVQRKPLSYYLNPTDDSDDDSLDLLTGSQSPALKLQTPIEQKGKEFTFCSFAVTTLAAVCGYSALYLSISHMRDSRFS